MAELWQRGKPGFLRVSRAEGGEAAPYRRRAQGGRRIFADARQLSGAGRRQEARQSRASCPCRARGGCAGGGAVGDIRAAAQPCRGDGRRRVEGAALALTRPLRRGRQCVGLSRNRTADDRTRIEWGTRWSVRVQVGGRGGTKRKRREQN